MATVVALLTVAVDGTAWEITKTSTHGPDNLVGALSNDEVNGVDGFKGNDFVSGGPGTADYCLADSADEIDFATCEIVIV